MCSGDIPPEYKAVNERTFPNPGEDSFGRVILKISCEKDSINMCLLS